jgi:hypothetical protein
MRAGKATVGFRLAGALVVLAAFLPFARVLLSGQSFFFRDLSVAFFPERRFFLEGLVQGDWRIWNPLVQEGVHINLPLFAYLPDFLQLLIPNEFGFSLFLALHVPFAVLSFFLLAKHLELSPQGAAVGALVYGLGGFTLATVNLYYPTQTTAWVPLFIIAFRRAVSSGRAREITLAALALATLISTLGIEIVIQACILAVVLQPPSDRQRLARSAASVSLAALLTAVITLPLILTAGPSKRAAGLPTWEVLSNSIHPLTFLQVAIASLYGDISNISGTWWGTNFFSNGFPYYLSLYLGPTVLALSWAGASASSHPLRKRLIAVVVLGVIVGLGRYAGWGWLLDRLPSVRVLRYPVKVFFTVQFALAMLAAFAASEMSGGSAPVLRRLARGGCVLGGILLAPIALPLLAPDWSASALAAFFPAELSASQRHTVVQMVVASSAVGGFICLIAGLVALASERGRVLPARAAAMFAVLVGADLVRAGAGLNPGVTQDFYRLSPEMSARLDDLRASGGRVFSCDPEGSLAFWEGRHARGANNDAFSMTVMQEALVPEFNLPYGVRTALSIDRTSLVPLNLVLSPELATCRDFGAIVPALRASGVNRVLSLDPLAHEGLRLLAEVSPARIKPVTIRIYELDGAIPRFSLPVTIAGEQSGRLDLRVTVDHPMPLTVLDPFAPGWRATVNGVSRPIVRTASGHREIPLEAGSNEVVMSYHPPGLKLGLGVTSAAALLCLGLLLADRFRSNRAPARESLP